MPCFRRTKKKHCGKIKYKIVLGLLTFRSNNNPLNKCVLTNLTVPSNKLQFNFRTPHCFNFNSGVTYCYWLAIMRLGSFFILLSHLKYNEMTAAITAIFKGVKCHRLIVISALKAVSLLSLLSAFLPTKAVEQTEKDTRSMPEATIRTVILSLMTVLSIAGNAFVCLAFYRNRRLRTITNFYVLSLAIADIMVATFVSPFYMVASGLCSWPFDFNLCQFTGFLSVYWTEVSLSVLTMTSINRYFCVVKPQLYPTFFTKKKTVFSILIIWIMMLVSSITFVLTTPVIYRWDQNSLYCRGTYHRRTEVTKTILACCILLPMSLVIFCYGSVYRVVKQHKTAIVPSLQGASRLGTITAHDIRTSRVLFFAVLGFCFSWTPHIVTSILESGFQMSIPSSVKSIPPIFAFISAWINPVIYGVMNRAMQKEFRNIIFCRKDK